MKHIYRLYILNEFYLILRFHGWFSIRLGWLQIHFTHKNGLKKKEIWNQLFFICSQYVPKISGKYFEFWKGSSQASKIHQGKKTMKRGREGMEKGWEGSPRQPVEKTERTRAVWFSGAKFWADSKKAFRQGTTQGFFFVFVLGSSQLIQAVHKLNLANRSWERGEVNLTKIHQPLALHSTPPLHQKQVAARR